MVPKLRSSSHGEIMKFTFYGDLLGISALYRLSSDMAYKKLNEFYKTVFDYVDEHWAGETGLDIKMFSDNILILGDDALIALEKISILYMNLQQKGLLLRGAMVRGRITFDPSLDRNNFRRELPKDTSLARAVGLENTQKGARFIVEIDLAQRLLRDIPEWLTHEGYIRNVNVSRFSHDHILRRICPTPDNDAYEVLYFWECSNGPKVVDYNRQRDELEEIKKMVREDVGKHYMETLDLLKRCESRQMFTDKHMAR
jgi:hypothetical protein